MESKQLMSERSPSEQPLQLQIPLVWQIQLEAIAQRTGQTLEQVVYQAIDHYLSQHLGQQLGQPDLRSSRIAPVGEFDDEEIEDEPDEILTSFAESDEFQAQVKQTIASNALADQLACEEIENEPDEILYGFLEP
jgi:hypothetical protein